MSIAVNNAAHGKETFTLSAMQDVKAIQLAVIIMKEAYAPLNIDIKVNYYPLARSIHIANTGISDGELVRTQVLPQSYPNLIKVPAALLSIDYHAFSKGKPLQPTGWPSLMPYHIGIRTGSNILSQALKGHKVTYANSMDQLWNLLLAGRLDLVIEADIEAFISFKGNPNKYMTINTLHPAIIKTPFYHYLHKDHEAILPRLTQSLENMKKIGRLKELKMNFIHLNH